jgi:hypothetical protein
LAFGRTARAIWADVFVCRIDKGAVLAPRKATALGKRAGTLASRASHFSRHATAPRLV